MKTNKIGMICLLPTIGTPNAGFSLTYRRKAMNAARNLFENSVSILALNINANADTEEIVIDERDGYSPSDLVQQKLQRLLPASAIPVSCLHAGRQVRRYPS